MRVIAGRWKGTKLQAANLTDFRPITDRIKESLFSVLGEEVLSALVLDLFAGSGSFGIEALSRGARHVVFVERSKQIGRVLRKNLFKLRCPPSNYELVLSDVSRALPIMQKRQAAFDIIFGDPPFRTPITNRLLKSIAEYDLLRRTGVFVLRHHKSEIVEESVDRLKLVRSKSYGDSVLKYYCIANQ